MALVLHEEGVRSAHIKRTTDAMPVVEWIASFPPLNASDGKSLETIARDLHASRYTCTTLLGPREYQLLSVEAPTVPQDELKTAIRWRLKDLLDFHVDDATIDVLDVPVDKDAPVRSRSMYAVAAKNQLIEQRQTLFSDAKIPLQVIDIPELAQRNFSALLEPKGRGIALLSFSADGGMLTVSYSGELYLSRRIDITLPQLAQASGDQRTAYFEKITLELQRSLDHFDRNYHFITMSKLILAPIGQEGAGLQEYLTENLYMVVESLNLESVLDISKVPELKAIDEQRRYFFTLGAALRLEEKVL